jgi:hypothetical protein
MPRVLETAVLVIRHRSRRSPDEARCGGFNKDAVVRAGARAQEVPQCSRGVKVLIRASESRRGVQIKPFEIKQLEAIGRALDAKY